MRVHTLIWGRSCIRFLPWFFPFFLSAFEVAFSRKVPRPLSCNASVVILVSMAHYGPCRGRLGVLVCVGDCAYFGLSHMPHFRITLKPLTASHLHCTARSSRSFTAIRKDAGLCCGSRLRKGEVFAYVGLPQNLKDLKPPYGAYRYEGV